jgi:hypothetical protein
MTLDQDAINRLTNIAADHEKRIPDLEDEKQAGYLEVATVITELPK